MTKLFCCKYPVVAGSNHKSEPVVLPIGSAFLVHSITGDFVNLTSVNKVEVFTPLFTNMPGYVSVSAAVFQMGFTENDFI